MRFNRFQPLPLIFLAAFAGEAIAQAMKQEQKDQKDQKGKMTIQDKKGPAGIQLQPAGTWWFQGSVRFSGASSCNNQRMYANGDTEAECNDKVNQIGAPSGCTVAQRYACVGRDVGTRKEIRKDVGPPDPTPVEASGFSNGCASKKAKPGSTWEAVQNELADIIQIKVGPFSVFSVNILEACNLHDAGYAGAVVWDRITYSNPTARDYRNYDRESVDDAFKNDVRTLCGKNLTGSAQVALPACYAKAELFFKIVRSGGWGTFDADLSQSGIQHSGPRQNSPWP